MKYQREEEKFNRVRETIAAGGEYRRSSSPLRHARSPEYLTGMPQYNPAWFSQESYESGPSMTENSPYYDSRILKSHEEAKWNYELYN